MKLLNTPFTVIKNAIADIKRKRMSPTERLHEDIRCERCKAEDEKNK